MNTTIPASVQNALWSYDSSRLDVENDKQLIIGSILAHGTLDAVRWLRATYAEADIRDVFHNSAASNWSPKTLHYWSVLLDTSPTHESRAATLV
jgi:hypothetical protein